MILITAIIGSAGYVALRLSGMSALYSACMSCVAVAVSAVVLLT